MRRALLTGLFFLALGTYTSPAQAGPCDGRSANVSCKNCTTTKDIKTKALQCAWDVAGNKCADRAGKSAPSFAMELDKCPVAAASVSVQEECGTMAIEIKGKAYKCVKAFKLGDVWQIDPADKQGHSLVLKACAAEDENAAKLLNGNGSSEYIGNFVALEGAPGEFGKIAVTKAAQRNHARYCAMEMVPGDTFRKLVDGPHLWTKTDLGFFVQDTLNAVEYATTKSGNKPLNDLHSDNIMAATPEEMKAAGRKVLHNASMNFVMIDIGFTTSTDFSTTFTSIAAPPTAGHYKFCDMLDHAIAKMKDPNVAGNGAWAKELREFACGAPGKTVILEGAKSAKEALAKFEDWKKKHP